jgi:hypothetical protein
MTESAFGSQQWLLEFLDISSSQFHRKKDALEAEGLPKPDPILRKYLKADVRAWVESRRTVRDPGKVEESTTATGVNFDAL